MLKRFAFLLLIVCALPFQAAAQNVAALKVATLPANVDSTDFAIKFRAKLAENKQLKPSDSDAASAAARAVLQAPENWFNLTLDAAKNLGAAIDCDYFFVIEHKVLPRSSFAKPEYFESDAVVFLASARTGRLIAWRDRYFEANSAANALKMQLADLPELTETFAAELVAAAQKERQERRAAPRAKAVMLDETLDETDKTFRQPLPFRRLKPEYTAAARRLEREATVDIEVELDARGNVVNTEIVRWAGFGLDESVTDAVKKMQFRPALRDNSPVGIKVLLRYNFRDSKQEQ